ncbi:aldo/keto reductase [Aliiglaciecola sp. CAU 1673]|uniref:aldo/keto reductase n=1 Tax=Aliiglaciecola sp. CAU 1673 TaxID=3032595 RepID=UPI0023DA0AFC|nr:aldo/keto reductase [Aliiglaciecola sp. CAU 1673]MDF2178302.1 aldo/keto reductase [Aliiglaciecola sp. CAU 1673]
MKLGLGTVQFGLDYGISNKDGQSSLEEAKQVVQAFSKAGAKVIDTSVLYGNSEEVLGQVLHDALPLKICSKISADTDSHGSVAGQIKQSLAHLKQTSIHAYLVHQSKPLFGPQGTSRYRELQAAKEAGLCNKIGYSVYDPDELAWLVQRYPPDIVQLPLNWFDMRFAQQGWLQKLADKGVEIHSRSLFLQGLLLMPITELPSFTRPFLQHLQAYHQAAERAGMSLLEAALCMSTKVDEISAFVLGCPNLQQAQQILEAYARVLQQPMDFSAFACEAGELIDPRLWPKTQA